MTREKAVLMTKVQLWIIGFAICLSCTHATFAQKQSVFLDESFVAQDAQPIVERFNEYYRGLQSFSCTALVSASLKALEIDEKVFLKASAERPNFVNVQVVENKGLFTTNQFVSNGSELFELSIRRRMHMLSPSPSHFSAMHKRLVSRSAPNVPVEAFIALLSEYPMEHLLQIKTEPGLIRLIGESEVNGVRCHEIGLNELGSRVWVRAEGSPVVLRYRNSPIVARPRYLPPGAQVNGLLIEIDFRSWGPLKPGDEDWTWVISEDSREFSTLHESAEGGPEDGYESISPIDKAGDKEGSVNVIGVAQGSSGESIQGGTPRPTGLAPGSALPDVSVLDLGGTPIPLQSLCEDQATALFFWRPGGKFTLSAAPRIMDVLQTFEDTQRIVPIGTGPDPDRVRRAIQSQSVLTGSYADPGAVCGGALNVRNVIAVVLVDSNQKVFASVVGAVPDFAKKLTNACKRLEAHEKTIEAKEEASVNE